MITEKLNLLLIENDSFTLPLYQRELSPHYSLFTCEKEIHAITTLQQETIDLIILEPASGNEWVWDFVHTLKQNEQTRTIPIIFCTVVDERKKGMEMGASAYLLKPVYANVLRQHVQDVLEKQEVPQKE